MAKNVKYTPRELYNLDITLLKTDPDQPRKIFDEAALNELSESVKTMGILQPILFRIDETGNHFIVAGERRYRATMQAGLKEIPAIFTDGKAAEIALVENMLREDLTPVEEAEALAKMRDELKYSQDELCKLLGMSQNSISEILSINLLPEEIKNDCRADFKCSKSKLVEIAKEKTPNKMLKLYERVKNVNMTTEQLRERRKKGKLRGNQKDVVQIQVKSLLTKIKSLPEHIEEERQEMLVKEFKKLIAGINSWMEKIKPPS